MDLALAHVSHRYNGVEVLRDISFEAPDKSGESYTVDAAYVHKALDGIAGDTDEAGAAGDPGRRPSPPAPAAAVQADNRFRPRTFSGQQSGRGSGNRSVTRRCFSSPHRSSTRPAVGNHNLVRARECLRRC